MKPGKFEKVKTAEAIEAMEMRHIEQRAIYRRVLESAERRAWEAEREVERQRRAYKKASANLAIGMALAACVVMTVACFACAPWWTALSPMVLAAALTWKAGWI